MGHGRMSCSLKTVRAVLTFVNVIFFLIGATILGEGIDLLITRRFQNFAELFANIENADITTKNQIFSDETLYFILIIPGLILLSVGFFGCSGAITQIQCLLFCYSWIIVFILIFQTMIIMSLIALRVELKEHLISTIQLLIREQYEGPLERNRHLPSFLWDFIMYHFKCCGIEDKNDFDISYKWNRTNPWWNGTKSSKNFRYPLTCCPISDILNKDKIEFKKMISCAMNGNDIYELGCYTKLINVFYSNEGTIIIMISFIIILEIIALMYVLLIYNRSQIHIVHHMMEEAPPPYSSRTRMNNANLYFQI